MSSSALVSSEVRYFLIAVSSRSSTLSMRAVSVTRLRSPRLSESSAPRSMASNTSTHAQRLARGAGDARAEGEAGRVVARSGQGAGVGRRADLRQAEPRSGQQRSDWWAEGGGRQRLVRGAAVGYRGHLQDLCRELQGRGSPSGTLLTLSTHSSARYPRRSGHRRRPREEGRKEASVWWVPR